MSIWQNNKKKKKKERKSKKSCVESSEVIVDILALGLGNRFTGGH